MRVELISMTPEAATVLLFTKQTRLAMTPGLLNQIREWPPEKKLAELQYMARTIRSSWEFVDITFLISGVTRSIAQQITRTRTASFAMQSMRVTNVADMEIQNPMFVGDYPADDSGTLRCAEIFEQAAQDATQAYSALVAEGVRLEDARDILPLGTTCNLVAKYNLRTLVDLVAARSSLRAQGPYREMVQMMKGIVLAEEPMFECFFADPRQEAFTMLEGVARELGITPGAGPAWEIAKALDLLRKEG